MRRASRHLQARRAFLRAAPAIVAAATSSCHRESAPKGRQGASLWFSYGGRNREVLERLVSRFNAEQPRFFIRAVFQGDYYEALAKLRTAIAARAGPTFSHVIGEVVPYLAEAGVLEVLDDYPRARDLGVLPALGQSGTWIGGDRRPLVALPFNRSTPIAYLNESIFRAARRQAPTTWSDLRHVAERLTRRENGRVIQHGFGCPISWWFWVALVGQAGGQVVEADGTVSLGGDAGVRALELWLTLIRDGSMRPPPGRDYNAWEATNQDFLSGRAAMIWTSTAFLKYLEENAPFRVLAAPLPAQQRHAVPTGGTHFVILRGADAAEKEAAWEFLRWMLEPTQTIEWATHTGYLPVTTEAIETLERSGYYARHPNDRVALDQLAVAMPWPWSPELFRLQREIVQPRLESVVLERRDPRALLEEARRLAKRSG